MQDFIRHPHSKRIAEIRRLFENQRREVLSQDSRLLFEFAETQIPGVLTEDKIETIWGFLEFLRKANYKISIKEE